MQLKDPHLLEALMKSLNISGRQLAEDIGWKSHTYLQRLLKGQVNTLKPDKAELIAFRLGVPRDVLFVPRVSGIPGRNDRDSEQGAA